MEAIPIADCIKIGYLQKPHSIHGELVFHYKPQFEQSIELADIFFIELDGLLVPFFLQEDGLKFRSAKTANLKFDWVNNENDAKKLAGNSVYLKKSGIIEPEETKPSFQNYINYTVESISLGNIGTITEINDYAGNVVFFVDYKDKEILLPFNEELLVSVDHSLKTIVLDLPQGLIEES